MIAERGPSGLHLVAIDEAGDRRFDAVVAPVTGGRHRDITPAVSPDGRWIVFASSREREGLAGTSLWIAPLAREATATRLSHGAWIDSHPAWAPDGRSVVFASTRDGGDFDLWRLPVANGVPGEAVPLTNGEGHEVAPSVAADGTIAFAVIEATRTAGKAQIASHLALRERDGTIVSLTAGGTENSPAFSPDGRRLAYTCAYVTSDRRAASHDLCMATVAELRADPEAVREPFIVLPPSDEDRPAWSRDGRYLFASSIVWGEGGALASSVIFVDTRARKRVAKLLVDHVGATPRLAPAIAGPLDDAVLGRNSAYLPALMRTLQRAMERQTEHQTEPATDEPVRSANAPDAS